MEVMLHLVTRNCFRGEAIARAAAVADFAPDLVVLQECARGAALEHALAEGTACWLGANPRHGLAVIAQNGWRVTRGPGDPSVTHSVFPVVAHGPADERLQLLAVWAQRRPSYTAAVRRGILAYATPLRAGPTAVLGDFNSHPAAVLGDGALGAAQALGDLALAAVLLGGAAEDVDDLAHRDSLGGHGIAPG
jgi:hypothetical protein